MPRNGEYVEKGHTSGGRQERDSAACSLRRMIWGTLEETILCPYRMR